VFLDLPAPWDAVDHAKAALRKDRTTRICCFSPCMEQVLRTVSALNEAGFTDITMYETLIRPHEVSQVPSLPAIGEICEKLKKAEHKREEKRLRQIANSRSNPSGKRKRGDGADEEIIQVAEDTWNKRVKTYDEDDTGSQIDVETSEANCDHPQSVQIGRSEVQPTDAYTSTTKINVSKVMPEVRGHTSYLTFACLVPVSLSEDTTSIINATDKDISSHA